MRNEALEQTQREWLDGPHCFTVWGELFRRDDELSINPVLRFRVQQGSKLKAAANQDLSKQDLRPHAPR